MNARKSQDCKKNVIHKNLVVHRKRNQLALVKKQANDLTPAPKKAAESTTDPQK